MSEQLEKIQAALDEDERREFVEELIEANQNEWDGSDSIEDLVKSKYAVVMRRHDDSWVGGADSLQDVAEREIEVLRADYDVEWVEEVYDLTTREAISYKKETVITVETEDGQIATASVPS